MTFDSPQQHKTVLSTEEKVDIALAFLRTEVLRAMAKHPGMNSPHEAFGVIYEEFIIEFGEAMKTNNEKDQMEEMIQVGAMAVRALVDVYRVGK